MKLAKTCGGKVYHLRRTHHTFQHAIDMFLSLQKILVKLQIQSVHEVQNKNNQWIHSVKISVIFKATSFNNCLKVVNGE